MQLNPREDYKKKIFLLNISHKFSYFSIFTLTRLQERNIYHRCRSDYDSCHIKSAWRNERKVFLIELHWLEGTTVWMRESSTWSWWKIEFSNWKSLENCDFLSKYLCWEYYIKILLVICCWIFILYLKFFKLCFKNNLLFL